MVAGDDLHPEIRIAKTRGGGHARAALHGIHHIVMAVTERWPASRCCRAGGRRDGVGQAAERAGCLQRPAVRPDVRR